MKTIRRIPHMPHLVGAVVTCGAVLGIASMIHPTDSSAIPVAPVPGAEHAHDGPTVAQGLSLGTLEGRGFEGEIIAGTPEATINVTDHDGELYPDLTLWELLEREGEFSQEPSIDGFEAWPEAIMDVDVPTDAW